MRNGVSSMKILLTGFDPFDREKVNPAFEAVKLLPDTIAGAQIVKLEVPTQFVRAGEVLVAAMEEHKPDVVICVGQAGGRRWFDRPPTPHWHRPALWPGSWRHPVLEYRLRGI